MERRYRTWNMNTEILLQFQQTLNTLIETLIKPETLKRDLFFAILLIVIKENDFVLQGNIEINVVDYILSKRTIEGDKTYKVAVILNTFQDTPARIIASPLSDMMLINALITYSNKEETYSLCLGINDYIKTNSLGIPSTLCNLDELFFTMRQNIVDPVKNCILNLHNQPSASLRGLPHDLLFQILLNLEIRDILSLFESCTQFSIVIKEESLWSRLFRRDFSSTVQHKSISWRDLYKDKYAKQKRNKLGTSNDVRSNTLDVIDELPDYMRPVRDSQWDVIL